MNDSSPGDWTNTVREDLNDVEMQTMFGGTDIIYDFVYVRRDTALTNNGFQKEVQKVAVFGKKACFLDKQIKTFYNSTIKDAITSIISDVADAKKSVLYSFSESSQAFDVDQLGILGRKKITVEYLAKAVERLLQISTTNASCLFSSLRYFQK